ncbi:MAG TPA: GNAT family N-acetyltransferase [Actinomycetes bacterium]|jgi:GNAT superfamily N-acetyltransferase|nr:GNAT family N-acetyltransferase [Actinomycetes bacterium]
MDIRLLDVDDQATVDGYYELSRLTWAADIPDFPAPCREGFLAGLRHPWPGAAHEHLLAWADGRVVGRVEVQLPQLDNRDSASILIAVRPDYRRRGIGTELLARAIDIASAHDRVRIVADTVGTLDGGPPRDPAGREFALAAGAKNAAAEVRRRLDLGTADATEHAELLVEAWRHADGYRLIFWHGSVPEAHLAQAAYLDGRLLEDAPLGELNWEPAKMDTSRFRSMEQAVMARRRRPYNAGAVHDSTGRLAAFTALAMDATIPDHAWQNITIVDPEHRGHRLGLLIKLANLARVRRVEPALAVLDTWNSEDNHRMIAINETIGYRPVDRWSNWQLAI